MKRYKIFGLIIIFLIISSLILSACSSNNANDSNDNTSKPSNSSSKVINWNNAYKHIGEEVTISGPVVTTKYASDSRGAPTFLNIGKPYPDSDRFTIVIWGENRDNFDSAPEDYYDSMTIEVTGVVD